MGISYKKLNNPSDLVVTIDEAKTHLRVVTTDQAEIDYITTLLKVAEQYCEKYTRRQLVPTNWAAYLDKFPSDNLLIIQKSPLIEVTEIKYFDTNNTEQTLAAANYEVDAVSEPPRIKFIDPPSTYDRMNAICVKFSSGYAKEDKTFDTAIVPKSIKQAILLIVGHLYEHREEVIVGVSQTEIDFGVDRLLDSERLFMF